MLRQASRTLRLSRCAPALRQRLLRTTIANGSGAEQQQQQQQQQHSPSDAELRLRILEAAMLEVPALGWTTDALSAGAAACELSPMAHGLLPRGPVELVEHFNDDCNARLAADLESRNEELASLEVHNRLLVAMQTRLRMIAPHVHSWPQALALRALPQNLPNTLASAHSLAKQLLEACGEDAKTPLVPPPVDPLVKLVSIGAIYGAAELHLLTDRSSEHGDTWAFVEKEVEALRTMAAAGSRLPDLSPANLMLKLVMGGGGSGFGGGGGFGGGSSRGNRDF